MSAIPRPVSCSNEALTCHLLQSTRKHKKKQNMTTSVYHLPNLISWIIKGGNVAHQSWQTKKIAHNQTHPSRADQFGTTDIFYLWTGQSNKLVLTYGVHP